jgi:hypothetical protein
MPNLTILQPTINFVAVPGKPFPVAGLATERGMPDPVEITSVTVRVDNGPLTPAALTVVPRQALSTVRFAASAQVTGGTGPHTVTVSATNEHRISTSKTVTVFVAPPSCVYPQSNTIRRSIRQELRAIEENKDKCASFYLDTLEGHSNPCIFGDPLCVEGKDHHQGLARTHRLSDGSIYFFLSHSETDTGDKGHLMHFRYSGPMEDEHVVETSPLTVAPLAQLLLIKEQHPCDMVFLPEVNQADGGYLFVAEQNTHNLSVYRWAPSQDFVLQGAIAHEPPMGGPNFVFLDKVDETYFLGIAFADPTGGSVRLFSAQPSALFPSCLPGRMNVSAFQPTSPESLFPFPVSAEAQQAKLVRDSTGQWFILGFRSDPADDPNGTDFVDVHSVEFSPFKISDLLFSVHISFKPGDTGFASTGTHYVEKSGRLLISSSYRWSSEEGPGSSGYVSRVDECPS